GINDYGCFIELANRVQQSVGVTIAVPSCIQSKQTIILLVHFFLSFLSVSPFHSKTNHHYKVQRSITRYHHPNWTLWHRLIVILYRRAHILPRPQYRVPFSLQALSGDPRQIIRRSSAVKVACLSTLESPLRCQPVYCSF